MKNLYLLFIIVVFAASCSKKSTPTPGTTATNQNTSNLAIVTIDIASGPGGTIVTITGTGFDPNAGYNQVFFNGAPATILSFSTTQIVAVVPIGAGTGPVSVEVGGKTVTGPFFTYQIAPFVYTVVLGTGRYVINAITTDLSGNVYISDAGSSVVRKIGYDGSLTTFWSSQGIYGITGLATDVSGNLYATDGSANVIRKITPAGVATIFAGSGVKGTADGTGTAASFSNPIGLTIDVIGNLYVADGGQTCPVRKITQAGTVTTLANANIYTRGIAVDPTGNVYVSIYSFAGITPINNFILKITPAGVISNFAGTGYAGTANGFGNSASFDEPLGLAADANGNIYVADSQNNAIRMITPVGVVSTLAGTGVAGYSDNIGFLAVFNNPNSIAIDKLGNLYVYDAGNIVMRKIVYQ